MEILEKLLGGMSAVDLIVFTVWGFIGMSIQMIADISKRKDKKSKVSWKYWLDANGSRLGIQVLVIPIAMVMFTFLFEKQLNIMNAFSVGFSIDFVIDLLKKKARLK